MARRVITPASRVNGDLDLKVEPRYGNRTSRLYIGGRLLAYQEINLNLGSSVQNYRLGARALADESIYRYCYNGGVALSAGVLVQSPVPPTDWKGLALVTNTVAGATSFTITLGATTAVTLNQLAGGYLCCDAGAGGVGVRLRIAGNTAATATNPTTITTVDAAPVAFTAGTHTFQFTMSPYMNVIVTPGTTPPTAKVLGATICAVSINYYFWLCTRGPVVLTNTTGTPTSGQTAVASLTGVGTFDEAPAEWIATTMPIGTVRRTASGTGVTTVDLMLE